MDRIVRESNIMLGIVYVQPGNPQSREENEELIDQLIMEKQQWLEQGYNTVIMGDFNAHIQRSRNINLQGENRNGNPLSMLFVPYKLCLAAKANRIKPLLNKIIKLNVALFKIGILCTTLVYNIMNFTENLQISGMLVLIDFQKGYGPVSWNFIYKTLDFLVFQKIL